MQFNQATFEKLVDRVKELEAAVAELLDDSGKAPLEKAPAPKPPAKGGSKK